MKAVELLDLPFAANSDAAWRSWANAVTAWLTANQAEPRAAIVLLPFVALIAPAHQALARQGGWMPRIETTRTLTASLRPSIAPLAPALSGDGVADRLVAGELLRRQAWAAAWAAADRRAFDQGVAAMVDAAQSFAAAAAALAPARREAWWRQARLQLGQVRAVGEREAALALIALEWAAASPPPPSDVLFDLRPSAWIVFTVGGVDALAASVVVEAARCGVAGLQLCADSSGDPFDLVNAALQNRGEDKARTPFEMPTLLLADDAEQEAMVAATAVIAALNDRADDDPRPVALIAEDRQIIRRIRALLARRGLQIADETGWALSTSRAGAHLMALLRALAPQASADARLDALKVEHSDADDGAALTDLEAMWRSGGLSPSDPQRREAANRLWARAQSGWAALAGGHTSVTLSEWLRALALHLRAGAGAHWWQDDAAGRAVWLALRLGDDQAFAHAAARIDRAEFTTWVASVLEASVFADASADIAAQVVVTPLARALWRPFFAVVVPGADSQHLGPPAPTPALLDDALLRELGMQDRATRARRTAQAFVQLLNAPRLTLLRRRSDGDEMQEASPLVDRLALALPAARRADWFFRHADLGAENHAATPVRHPLPVAAAALPATLSASQVEALRDCPYRFFALAVLRLRSVDELDADADKRLYGNWLHATLKHFHDHRARLAALPELEQAQADFMAAAEAALAALSSAGDAADAERMRVDLLPFRVGLPALAQRYLDWLAGHEAQAWRYLGGEIGRRSAPAELDGVALVGRLDRIDGQGLVAADSPDLDRLPFRPAERGQAPPRTWMLIDYKTGNAEALKRKVRQPLEDTQLAFYAAISAPALAEGDTLQAQYLALDDREAVRAIVHPDVGDSAQALLAGLADEWQRLRAGAALPALGEGSVCEFCDARGLCRRDRWGPA